MLKVCQRPSSENHEQAESEQPRGDPDDQPSSIEALRINSYKMRLRLVCCTSPSDRKPSTDQCEQRNIQYRERGFRRRSNVGEQPRPSDIYPGGDEKYR